ncbi:MAG: DUF3693 domain-containing protein [Thermomonas sp.]|uniref:DUF3693 domain-containing protein n=1 Tax=Thermomonas sp. TaxID=1971895 RepID=UPI0039E3A98A
MNVSELLDAAKRKQGIATDMALADALDVSRSAVSSWRKGVQLPDAVRCAALAGLTGEPLAKVLGIVGEARAISREEKSVWRRLAATAAALLLTAGIFHAPQATARVSEGQSINANPYALCIMRNSLM